MDDSEERIRLLSCDVEHPEGDDVGGRWTPGKGQNSDERCLGAMKGANWR
jgi:hypothetical protein